MFIIIGRPHAVEDLPLLKAYLFFRQYKNQLFLSYKEKQIYRNTDCCNVAAVRFWS